MTRTMIDLTFQRFERLWALRPDGQDKYKNFRWICLCDCGTKLTVTSGNLRSRRTKSCGCLNRDIISLRNTSHGYSKHGKGSDNRSGAYRSWEAMRRRCNNPADHGYADYGGRGITVCERWDTFENFLADMGDKPAPGHAATLDRIDNEGNYEPGNCRWATPLEQRHNRRDTRL